jgi:Mrp family chromosome partitioning ATPase
MSIVEQPTPPYIDKKKLMKLLGGVFGACAACGLGLAFLIDLVLDRTLKRSTDIERHLRMPVFLSIPDSSWTSRKWLPGFRRNGSGRTARNGASDPDLAVEQWNPRHHLQSYTEGLRERVITYFENKNMGLKKPKLVGVTGCGHGSGVSTLASGLAAALSATGDGNVLLVDMNAGNGVAHSFYKGKPGCGISDVLGADSRADAQVQSNLYLAAVGQGDPDKLTKAPPTGFNHLVPQLKASDYDYIIFDFPPVTQTSPTPRLASHMDITLLVVESEKTGQQLASRAAALMRESRVTMAAVLNKYRPHLPARLSQEL